jgi:CRISPR-associated protein Cmr5
MAQQPATITRRVQPSLDQQRAAYAWQCVQHIPKDYDKLAKAAPALIMNNGLMQMLAFYQDKGKTNEGVMDRYHTLNAHLMRWLGRQFNDNEFPSEQKVSFDTVLPALYNAKPELFRRATEETLALLRWIRQFAAAISED